MFCDPVDIRMVFFVHAGNMEILFRTNDAGRYPGFEGTVICFDPAVADQPGCTRPEMDPETRRKRNTWVSIYNHLL